MPDVNCRFPITIRLMGNISDVELQQLADVLQRSLVARIAFADQTLATANPHLIADTDRRLVSETYDPSREGPTSYVLPSYQTSGQKTQVPLKKSAATLNRRPWFIRIASNFHAGIGNYLNYVQSVRPDRSLPEKVLYFDLFAQSRWVSVWLVQVNIAYDSRELFSILYKRAAELSHIDPSRQLLAYAQAFDEGARQDLISIDEDGVVNREMPELTRNNAYIKFEGADAKLKPGSWVLVTTMVLPKIELEDVATLDVDVLLPLKLRDLTFLMPAARFEHDFHISWDTYIQEFGDRPVTLHLQPLTTKKRIHYLALEYLVGQAVSARVQGQLADRDSLYVSRLDLLNSSSIDKLPAAVRSNVVALTNDVTRSLADDVVQGDWLPNWRGAFFLAVTTITTDDIGAAAYRPQAREITPRLLAKLNGDPDESEWGFAFWRFIEHTFGQPPDERPPGGTPFEYVLEQLENQGKLDLLFDKVEQARIGGVYTLVIRHALATRYATHPRVRRSHDQLIKLSLAHRKNVYNVAERQLWLDRDSDKTVGVGSVFGVVSSIYIFERKDQRLKPARIPAFRDALIDERKELMGRILRGEETRQFTEEDFTRETIGKAVKRIHLSKDDFEEVKIQRSMRLLGLEGGTVNALPRFYITFEFVERVVGEEWQRASQPIIETDGEFEFRLTAWELGKAGEFWNAVGLAISVVGLVAIAWEAGIIALLVEAAGGATAVLVSITLSELLYIIRVVFGNAELSLGGFLEAALEGYLMALGFRGGHVLGRVAFKTIGTATTRDVVAGIIADRLTTGIVGGAASAALIKFSHDVTNIATGKGGWSSIGDYVHEMTWGALLGTAFEFGAAALGPIARAVGKGAFESLSEVAQQVKAEGFTAVRWTALTADALGNMRARLSSIIGDVAADGFVKAMSERLSQVTEQLGQEYRLTVFRRVLELSPEALTPESVNGLEKFLNASRADLTNEAALNILNNLKPAELRAFLQALNKAEARVIGALAHSGELESLAGAPRTLDVIASDPALSNIVARTASLPRAAASARVRAVAEVAAEGPAPSGAGTTPGPSLLQRQRGAAVWSEAASVERSVASLRSEAADLETRAAAARAGNPARADRLVAQAARRRRIATILEGDVPRMHREAVEYESGRRSATTDLPGPEDIDLLLQEARAESQLIRVPLASAERDPNLLPRLTRPLLESRSGNRVVFRVEGGGSRELVSIGPNNDVTLTRGATIYLNFGSSERAVEFLSKRGSGAKIVAFEVDKAWVESVRSAAIPEHGTGTLQGQPRLVDIRFAGDQMEIPGNLVDEVQQFIVPGSGRVLQVVP